MRLCCMIHEVSNFSIHGENVAFVQPWNDTHKKSRNLEYNSSEDIWIPNTTI